MMPIAHCKEIRKFLLVEFGIRVIFLVVGMLPTIGFRNGPQTKDLKSSTWNPESKAWNNPRLCWIPLHGANP